MICENCKQRPATVTLTMTKDNEQFEKHYCEICSVKHDFTNMDSNSKPMSIEDIFSSWFGIPTWSTNSADVKDKKQEPIKCEVCGMTYDQFLHEGKFNCPSCYEHFHELLPTVFKRLHNGATEHTGKIPSGLTNRYQIKKQIDDLRQQMKQVILEENFEEAASIRDQVKELELLLSQGGVEKNED